jgi:hypothetical protein
VAVEERRLPNPFPFDRSVEPLKIEYCTVLDADALKSIPVTVILILLLAEVGVIDAVREVD